MLSLLPQILFLGTLAPSVIRLTLAGMLAYSAWKNASRGAIDVRAFSLFETAVAASLVLGAWTQLFAMVGSLILALSLYLPQFRVWPRSSVALMLVMMLTLIVTGPGAFAFDLPL
jgi:uncharacterized membrane protein YphA (DoxX/SURF4 family)